MNKIPKSLLNIVNASGFLFQMRVAKEIENTYEEHNWNIASKEHRWSIEDQGIEGYIDLIIQKGTHRMIIECKRLRDANWIFLISDDEFKEVFRSRLCWWKYFPEKKELFEFNNFDLDPSSAQSSFCVIKGQSDKDKPMLERLCDNLLKSVESIADEELNTFKKYYTNQFTTNRLYIPAIVTNAELKIFNFKVEDVDIEKGEFPNNLLQDEQFQTVPFIRFRKALTTTFNTNIKKTLSISNINKENERTVFIINASELSSFLNKFDVFPLSINNPWADL